MAGLVKQPYILLNDTACCYIRPQSIDRWIATENLVLDQYHLATLSHLPFDTIIDIGANIGAFTLQAAALFPKAHLVAYDPYLPSYELLQRNLTLNNLKPRVIAKNAAVTISDQPTTTLYLQQDTGAHSTTVKSSRSIKVPNVNYGEALQESQGWTLTKIDIEGGEYALLPTSVLLMLQYCTAVIFEYHDEFAETGPSHLITDRLQPYGYLQSLEERQFIFWPSRQ